MARKELIFVFVDICSLIIEYRSQVPLEKNHHLSIMSKLILPHLIGLCAKCYFYSPLVIRGVSGERFEEDGNFINMFTSIS